MDEAVKTVTADDLTPEMRKVMRILHGGQRTIVSIARELGCQYRISDASVRRLRDIGLIEIGEREIVSLTEAGRGFDLQTSTSKKLQNLTFNAGMMPKQIEAAEKKLERKINREIARAHRRKVGLIEELDRGFVTSPSMPELPDDFVQTAAEECRIAIRRGNFDSLHELAEDFRERWDRIRLAMSPLAKKPIGLRLATYLSECQHPDTGKLIDVRIVNAVEKVCPATLGSVLENWPNAFAGQANVGQLMIELLGKVLLSAGLIDSEEHDRRMTDSGLKDILRRKKHRKQCEEELRYAVA
jgi:Mn-dependent DtxR family transcriptional regulator